MANSQIEFKTLKDQMEAHLATLTAPGVKQTNEVVQARQQIEAMLVAYRGVCCTMLVDIETE